MISGIRPGVACRMEKREPEVPAYSIWIASDGQTSTQVWQSTHMSLSTFALSFSMEIADAGHSLTQVSHPVHLSLSTIATNSFTPFYIFLFRVKKGLLSKHNRTQENGGRSVGREQAGQVISSARARRPCHRCRASFRQPSGLQAGHRLQRPSGRRHGGRVRWSRSSSSTSPCGRPRYPRRG